MKHRSILISFILFFAAVIALSAVSLQEKMDALMVYGDGFIFGVQEPENWTGDTGNAIRFHANVIFYPKGQAWNSQGAVIRVRINKKVDELTAEDLATDMAGYRNKYSQVQFMDIDATHPRYRCYPKLFFVENDFYEYVTYVNPGEAYWYTFSVALNSQKKQADEAELAAYRKVVSSLLAISGSSVSAVAPEANPTEYNAALKAAEDNMKSGKGKRYDESFGRNLAPTLAQIMMMCTKDIPASAGIAPFVILVRVGPSGEAENIIVHPETQVALCVKGQIPVAGHPKPPGPSWWVKVDVTVELKDVYAGGLREPGRTGDDSGYSRRYSYWSMFAPGSSVRYRYSRKTADSVEEIVTTFTLKDATPECVYLECSTSNVSGADPSAGSVAGLVQLEFREADDEFQGWDLFGVRLGYNVFHALRNPAAKVMGEGREDLFIMGTPLPTAKKSIRFGSSDSTTTLTVWLSEDIPGKIVKYVRELKGAISVREEAVAVEYRAIKADKAEIERLRASRKSSPLDIAAWDYLTVRLGLVDDYNVAFRDFTDARNDIRSSFLENLNTNSANLKKSLSLARNKLKELNDRLNQDIRSVEKEIGSAEFAKLRPITREAVRFASLLIKEADLYIAIAGATAGGHVDLEYRTSLKAKSDGLRVGITKVHQGFRNELNLLKEARIKFFR